MLWYSVLIQCQGPPLTLSGHKRAAKEWGKERRSSIQLGAQTTRQLGGPMLSSEPNPRRASDTSCSCIQLPPPMTWSEVQARRK